MTVLPLRQSDIPTRAKVDPNKILANIEQLLAMLFRGQLPTFKLPSGGTAPSVVARQEDHPLQWVPMDKDDVARIQACLNGQFKLLGKVLPDLKNVEFSDKTDRPALSLQELAQRLVGVLAIAAESGNPLPALPFLGGQSQPTVGEKVCSNQNVLPKLTVSERQ